MKQQGKAHSASHILREWFAFLAGLRRGQRVALTIVIAAMITAALLPVIVTTISVSAAVPKTKSGFDFTTAHGHEWSMLPPQTKKAAMGEYFAAHPGLKGRCETLGPDYIAYTTDQAVMEGQNQTEVAGVVVDQVLSRNKCK